MPNRQSSQVIFLLAVLAFIFCLTNIYQSLYGTVTSSHAVFQSDDSDTKHGILFRFLVSAFHLEKRHSSSVIKSTYYNGSGQGDAFREQSSKDHIHKKLNERYLFEELKVKRPPDPPPYNRKVKGQHIPVPLWQRRLYSRLKRKDGGTNITIDDVDHRYLLVELLQVRIYENDRGKMTIAELKQWMHYMFLAGVEHIYICDHYQNKTEMLERHVKRYIELGLVTYLEWGEISYPLSAQIKCYQHIINEHKYESLWQIAVDMDEYPFSLNDTSEDFLVHILQQMPPYVTEISLTNYLMLGQGNRSRDMMIDRVERMTPREANVLVKPMYRPERVQANVHHNHLLMGKRVVAPPDILKMLHYWGARVQDFGPDTPHTLGITQPMTAMRDAWAERVRNSLLVFGEFDAFSSTTGP